MAKDAKAVAYHVMPGWFVGFRDKVVLPALIFAQWIVTTLMILLISVGDPRNWQQWAWTDWCNGIVAVLIGLASAGVALGISAAVAESFAEGRWGRGLFSLVGVMLLVSVDVWSGVAERSLTARPTPADTLLAQWTGIDALNSVPLSVLLVACLHAALILYYGWTNRPTDTESETAAEARRKKQLAEARYKAELNAIRARGLGAAIGGGLSSVKETFSHQEGEQVSTDNQTPLPAPITPATPGITSEYDAASDQADSNVTPLRPKGRGSMWTAADLVRHVEQTYGYTLSQGEAVGFIKAMKNAQQLEGVPGKPWAAHQATVKAWAKARSWPVGAQVTAG